MIFPVRQDLKCSAMKALKKNLGGGLWISYIVLSLAWLLGKYITSHVPYPKGSTMEFV